MSLGTLISGYDDSTVTFYSCGGTKCSNILQHFDVEDLFDNNVERTKYNFSSMFFAMIICKNNHTIKMFLVDNTYKINTIILKDKLQLSKYLDYDNFYYVNRTLSYAYDYAFAYIECPYENDVATITFDDEFHTFSCNDEGFEVYDSSLLLNFPFTLRHKDAEYKLVYHKLDKQCDRFKIYSQYKIFMYGVVNKN